MLFGKTMQKLAVRIFLKYSLYFNRRLKMKKTLLLLFLFPVIVFANTTWSKTGHRVTGQIAQNYLSGKAKRALNDLLDGHSLAFVSTFADAIKADRA